MGATHIPRPALCPSLRKSWWLMYMRPEPLDEAKPSPKKAQGKETWPTMETEMEMEQMETHYSQGHVSMWGSLGKRHARLTDFNENTGIQFLMGSKTFPAWLLCLSPMGRWVRHLGTTQLCPLLLPGASLCPVTLPFPHLGLLQALRDFPLYPATCLQNPWEWRFLVDNPPSAESD